MTPLRNLIAVKPCASDDISEGGIFMPDSFKQRGSKAIVVSAGAKTKLKVGQTVFHIAGAGDELIENGETVFLMPDKEVLGYLEN
jgi:co-chaperonin GroES (HSP10)